MSYALARPVTLDLESYCTATDLHPELVQKLVTLGLVDARTDATGQQWFEPGQVGRAARLRRLRVGLGLNYASLGTVIDLLDRVAVLTDQVALLEARVRGLSRGRRAWN